MKQGGRGGSRGPSGGTWARRKQGGTGAWDDHGHTQETQWKQPEMETEAIVMHDYTYQSGTLTKKAADAIRALHTGEIDANTRPILEKWEVKVRAAIRVGTQVPDPPNWRSAISRSSGGGGWGESANQGAFLQAAQAPKSKNKGKKKTNTTSAVVASTGLDDYTENRIQELSQFMQQITANQQRLYEQQDTISVALTQMAAKIQERDMLIIQQLYALGGAAAATTPISIPKSMPATDPYQQTAHVATSYQPAMDTSSWGNTAQTPAQTAAMAAATGQVGSGIAELTQHLTLQAKK